MSVAAYLAKLPPEHRAALARVRDVVNAHLPAGYEEGMLFGMPSWFVPKSTLAETYNGQPLMLAALGSRKGYMTLYLMSVYGDEKLRAWFERAFAKAGKKLDMGKSCVRFKTLDALPLDVIGEAIAKVPVAKYVAAYHASRRANRGSKQNSGSKKPARKKTRAR